VVGLVLLGLAVWVGTRGPQGPHGNTLGRYALAGTVVGSLVAMSIGWQWPGRSARFVSLLAVVGGLGSLVLGAVLLGGPITAVLVAGLVFGLGGLVIVLGALAGSLLWRAIGSAT
jgi:hypothetical protein